jgi:uncharacterized membrane protein YkvA (DUF1232 family)
VSKTAALTKVERANEEKVRAGFLKKVARVAAHIPFAADAVALYLAALDPDTPKKTKALLFGALAYFVLPTDAVPDIFAGVGFTDDAAVIAAVLALAGSSIKQRHRDEARAMLLRWKA